MRNGERDLFGRLSLALLVAVGMLAALALVTVDDAAAQQTGERPGQPIIIRWSTETEVNTAGFNVYRSSSEEGPWQKINPRLIPGSPDPLRGGSYVFTDTNVIAGATYWYELEEIELGGQATRLERTQATAGSQGLGALAGLPCGSALTTLLAVGLGMVALGRRARSYGQP